MRAGVIGFLPLDPRALTTTIAARIKALGFSGVAVRIPDPSTARRSEYVQAREILADVGLRVAQVVPQNAILIHPDPERRLVGRRAYQDVCRFAHWLQAETIYVRPGSWNAAGPWTPHPENTSLQTLAQVVTGLQEVARAAEDVGIPLAIEGASVSPLDTPERMRDVIEAVGSAAVRFNADPVNFVGSFPELYDTTSLVHRVFDLCGTYTVCAHIKDLTYENALPLRLRECLLGDGVFDNATFLQRFERACPNGFVLIEHLPDDQIPEAKARLDRLVARAGTALQQSIDSRTGRSLNA